MKDSERKLLEYSKIFIKEDGVYCKAMNKAVAVTDIVGHSSAFMAKPCCQFFNHIDGLDCSALDIRNFNNLNDILTSDIQKELREKSPNVNCESCMHEEIHFGKESLRQHYKNQFKDEKIALEEIHFTIDNLCNMSCLSCNATKSSSWNKKTNLKDLLTISQEFVGLDGNIVSEYVKTLKKLIENTDYTELKKLKIAGGEPFYSENFYWIINKINEKCDISQVELQINTNGSIIPKDNIWKIIENFKKVYLDISVDAVGQYHEYIRYGRKWQDILNFIDFVQNNRHKNIILSLHSVYSILNFNVFKDIIEFSRVKGILHTWQVLFGPKFLSIQTLPSSIRNDYKIHGNISINKILDNKSVLKTGGKLGQYLALMEKENNNRLEDYNPELKQIIMDFNL